MPTTTENRQAQYLRILTEGPQKTLSDAEAAQWLIDEGYAKGHVRDLSHLRYPTDADVEYIWQGITHEGRIFIDKLQSQSGQLERQTTNKSDTKNTVTQEEAAERKLWHEQSTLQAIIVGVLITVIGGLIASGIMMLFASGE